MNPMNQKPHIFSRRTVLGAAGVLGVTGLLSACGLSG